MVTGPKEVGLAVIMVLIAIAVGRYWKLPVLKDMVWGSLRAFVQLVAVGYAIKFIFGMESVWLMSLALLVMTVIGAHAAAGRVQGVKGAFAINLVSILSGSVITLATMLIFDIIRLEARYVIPLSGMIIGNSMNASALTMDRLASDMRSNRLAVETALALGRRWREASHKYQRDAARTGMVAILNFLKTVGIVALPGAMTGMILAGADPVEAVLLQVIVAYMLLAATTITSIMAVELTVRTFFTRFHQLKLTP
ncbi:MAG: iron export ABC transporter permease subunit FetB [candidate division Zixibacteria bacterium]|nr:iron export ABC transporter permease subunit FetB [candidate division Zixibacteria bacterium]MDH3938075.1 iron export ABC transporter permease subunit FetB [candidate division Zixibacteria bacterium]